MKHDLAAILRGTQEPANTDRFTADNIQPFTTQCEGCKHMQVRNTTCAAFPEGIPNAIIGGAADHTQPYPGDNGITFEPK